uniref:Shisa N-terminal domain-containing protein n=1 Tax=Lates calcarifer TaxID=8187 RepID=A0A4W6DXM0_LATCA
QLWFPEPCPVLCVFSVSHWDDNGHHHESFQCGTMHCCGGCNKKYCCSEQENYLSQEDSVGGIVSVFPVVFCVALVVCFVCPCCMLHQRCCKRRETESVTLPTVVINPTDVPLQTGSPSGYQLFYLGYQPVPVQHGRGGQPVPTAPPPSYMEASEFWLKDKC